MVEADGGRALTFFEVLTLLAFAAFADAPVSVGVVEVGLGGAWDSTNVIEPARRRRDAGRHGPHGLAR